MEPTKPLAAPFQLNPAQQQIHRRLLMIGPGAAALYRDACRLMAVDPALDTTTHLVAHLLRETESALRAVLLPQGFQPPEPCPECGNEPGRHRKEIEAILQGWGLDDKGRVREAWLMLAAGTGKATLGAYVHRRDLGEPRPADKQFQEVWRRMESLLDEILRGVEANYLKFLPVLDGLLATSNPRRDNAKFLKNHVPNSPVCLSYFFDRLKSPAWLQPLRAEGFFRRPPKPVYDVERGVTSFPRWPQAEYLARIAKVDGAQALVRDVVLEIPETENMEVHLAVTEAVIALPAEAVVEWAGREAAWVCSQRHLDWLLAERYATLVVRLGLAGQVDAALDLARPLLAPILDTDSDSASRAGSLSGLLEARPRFDVWDYARLLSGIVQQLKGVVGERLLGVLCDLLASDIGLSRVDGEDRRPEDSSGIWRPAIEEHEQNRLNTLRDALVGAVRDTAEAMEPKARLALEIVEAQPYKVFWRIGLHLRRRWPHVDRDGAAKLLVDPERFDDPDGRHELFHLLREQFGSLPQETRQAYLTLAAGCPPHRQYRALCPIQSYLQGEWVERFDALREQFGELEHPDFDSPMTVRAGPTAPVEPERLRSMSIEEIVSYLATWQPIRDFIAPSPEGLGRELGALVASDPQRFAADSRRFEGLDPTYVRALITGLGQAAGGQRPFVWAAVLELCAWVLHQPREIAGRHDDLMFRDTGWGWTRKAIADTLRVGFSEGPAEIPFDLRSSAWAVLEPLCEDPEPTPEYEERQHCSVRNLLNLSINTTRGTAMHAVMHYARWVHRHVGRSLSRGQPWPPGFDHMPEVREVLDAHLDPTHDPSLAVRAVYGQWLPALVHLDGQWTAAHLSRIFPPEDSLRRLRDAAWESYLLCHQPQPHVFDLLRDEYGHAVQRIGAFPGIESEGAWAEARLAQHLMMLYWWGLADLNDPAGLLSRFYEKAPEALRARALEYLGSALEGATDGIAPATLVRLRILWERRASEVCRGTPTGSPSAEMVAFGRWFASGRFEDQWSITQLLEALRLGGKADPDGLIVERLAKVAAAEPGKAVECLRLIIQGDKAGWGILRWRENIRAVLRTAIESGDSAARQAAIDFVNSLACLGHLEFRDLVL